MRNQGKVQLAAYEFIFWLLGNFRTVAEIEEHLGEVELMSEKNSDTKYGNPELHFAVVRVIFVSAPQ